MRNWEFTNYTCKEMYVSHIAFLIKWLSQSAHSQRESSQNGLQPNLVIISSLDSKWQGLKVGMLVFRLFYEMKLKTDQV